LDYRSLFYCSKFEAQTQNCLTKKIKEMFSADNVRKMATTLVIVMVALAVHQKFVAPRLAAAPKPAGK
jgi:hypothetical protein